MNVSEFVDPVFSSRLCLTLLHTLWQAALPEPFSFINEILQETIDDVLLAATVKEAASALESAKPVPDDESGAAVLGAGVDGFGFSRVAVWTGGAGIVLVISLYARRSRVLAGGNP